MDSAVLGASSWCGDRSQTAARAALGDAGYEDAYGRVGGDPGHRAI